MAIIPAVVVAFGGVMLATWIGRGDVPRVIGTAVGIVVCAAILGGLFAWLARYWRPVRAGVAELARRHPDAVVLAARLPRIPVTTVEQSWTPGGERLPAQEGALVVDQHALTFHSVRAGVPQPLLSVPWMEMRSLTPVEFVEVKIAYQGLLLEGPETGYRVVFQPSVPAWIVPAFPTGDQLRDVRDRIMQQHPRRTR